MGAVAAYRKIVEDLIRRYASKPSHGVIEPERRDTPDTASVEAGQRIAYHQL